MSSSFKDTDLEVAFFRLAAPQTVDFGVCVICSHVRNITGIIRRINSRENVEAKYLEQTETLAKSNISSICLVGHLWIRFALIYTKYVC